MSNCCSIRSFFVKVELVFLRYFVDNGIMKIGAQLVPDIDDSQGEYGLLFVVLLERVCHRFERFELLSELLEREVHADLVVVKVEHANHEFDEFLASLLGIRIDKSLAFWILASELCVDDDQSERLDDGVANEGKLYGSEQTAC